MTGRTREALLNFSFRVLVVKIWLWLNWKMKNEKLQGFVQRKIEANIKSTKHDTNFHLSDYKATIKRQSINKLFSLSSHTVCFSLFVLNRHMAFMRRKKMRKTNHPASFFPTSHSFHSTTVRDMNKFTTWALLVDNFSLISKKNSNYPSSLSSERATKWKVTMWKAKNKFQKFIKS